MPFLGFCEPVKVNFLPASAGRLGIPAPAAGSGPWIRRSKSQPVRGVPINTIGQEVGISVAKGKCWAQTAEW